MCFRCPLRDTGPLPVWPRVQQLQDWMSIVDRCVELRYAIISESANAAGHEPLRVPKYTEYWATLSQDDGNALRKKLGELLFDFLSRTGVPRGVAEIGRAHV